MNKKNILIGILSIILILLIFKKCESDKLIASDYSAEKEYIDSLESLAMYELQVIDSFYRITIQKEKDYKKLYDSKISNIKTRYVLVADTIKNFTNTEKLNILGDVYNTVVKGLNISNETYACFDSIGQIALIDTFVQLEATRAELSEATQYIRVQSETIDTLIIFNKEKDDAIEKLIIAKNTEEIIVKSLSTEIGEERKQRKKENRRRTIRETFTNIGISIVSFLTGLAIK